MLKQSLVFIVLLLSIPQKSQCQVLLNGDFENNSAVFSQYNISNTQYNSFMMDSKAFGTYGNMDIIDTNIFCGSGAQHGNWYVGITGGGGDMISLKLSDSLIPGNLYHLSFYDRFPAYDTPESHPFQIGLSQSDTSFGTVIYNAPLADTCIWTQRNFSFTAPNNGQFITVRLASGTAFDSWCHLDNMVFTANLSIPSDFDEHQSKVYPNPFTNSIFISGINENTDFYLYNYWGKLLRVSNIFTLNSPIPMDDLRSGIYFVKLVNSHGEAIHKIIKMN